jgi:hypothetical protein
LMIDHVPVRSTLMGRQPVFSAAECEKALQGAFRHLQADTSHVTFEIHESTVKLRGRIASERDRMEIVNSFAGVAGVDQIIDLLHLAGENASYDIYHPQGSDALTRMAAVTYGEDTTWDERARAKSPESPRHSSLPGKLGVSLWRAMAAAGRAARAIFHVLTLRSNSRDPLTRRAGSRAGGKRPLSASARAS